VDSRALFIVSCTSCLAGSAITPASASKPALASTWMTAAPRIDGVAKPDQKPAVVSEKSAVSLVAANDGEWLYLAFTSDDPAIARMAMMRGLRLEITAKGGTPLAVGFPLGGGMRMGRGQRWDRGGGGRSATAKGDASSLGRPAGDVPPESQNGESAGRAPGTAPDGGARMPPGPPPGVSEDASDVPPGAPGAAAGMRGSETFDLYGKKDEVQHMMVNNDLGIELRARARQNSLVYEVRVPLVHTDETPYAVGAVPGGIITVSLKPRPMEKPRGGDGPGGPGGMGGGGDMGGPSGMGGGPEGMGGPGRMGGGGMGRHGGMGGGPPGGGHGWGAQGASLDLEFKVALAAPPKPAATASGPNANEH
jgi:hypothetical protein